MDITQPRSGRVDALQSTAREAVYRTILSRRDVRGEFLPDPVSPARLSRILLMAHHAPSVGFMQPWDFILIRDQSVKEQVHGLFERANAEAAMMFEQSKRAVYRSLKLEGILESPLNICVTCDRERAGPVVIGRTHIPFMDLFSSVCAVQNLWLAARAEGLGLGWVSIVDNAALRRLLGIPRTIVPVAYLCIGHVKRFHDRPELEECGWRPRLPIGDLIHFDRWQEHHRDAPLLSRLKRDQDAIEDGTFLSSHLG
jgi:5,6-dimethylbenzimidazole synthase